MRLGGVIVAVVVAAQLVAGCAGPPPALPASVMAQGVEAVPEKHPKMTEQQAAACGDCHRTSDAPTN